MGGSFFLLRNGAWVNLVSAYSSVQPVNETMETAVHADPGNAAPSKPGRLLSLDTYRGFVMFLMMAEVLRLSKVASAFPESNFWKFLAHHQTHVDWVGCSLHDLIQPSFSFMVG